MKKLYLSAVLALAGTLFAPHTQASNGTRYYAKVTVGVAEDSKGLGTVYILEDEQELTEVELSGEDFGDMNHGAQVGVEIHNTPADGYVLSHFTDQNGESYTYPEASAGTNPYIIGLFATSTDEADPTVYNLLAHFVKESELPKEELAEAVITAEDKYGTFMSPVPTTIPTELLAYRILYIKEGAVIITPFDNRELPAFTPVLLENISMFAATIKATYSKEELPEELPSMTEGLLTGVMEETVVPEGAYILSADGDNTTFRKVTDEETSIDAFTAYLSDEEATEESYPLIPESQVSVNELIENLQQGKIYDLEGRKLNSLQKGINIVGGVKVIVE